MEKQIATEPNPEDLKMLIERFRFVDLNHPVHITLFEFVKEILPPAGVAQATHHKERKSKTSSIKNVDPMLMLQKEIKLPSLPTVYAEFQAAVSSKYVTSDKLAEIVSTDLSLTAWILKLVNSPFFGFSTRVDTVSRAITLIGVEQLKNLIMGGVLNNLTLGLPKDIIDIQEFWRHSIATALAAQSLWKLMGRQESERLFVAGILHDCGLLALASSAPNVFSNLAHKMLETNMPRHEAEQTLLGFDHAKFGAMLLQHWNMPISLVMSTLRHHQPDAPQKNLEAAVVHVADIIACSVAGRTQYDLVPPVNNAAWEALGLNLANLRFVADKVLANLADMYSVMTK